MPIHYKASFPTLPRQSPMKGVRHKDIDQNGIRMRLVEYTEEMPLHWCEKGHYGYVIEGELEIEFENGKVKYEKGDGIFIPDGPDHRHRGKALTEEALIFFIEKV